MSENICQYKDVCGGCSLLDLPYNEQCKRKKAAFEKAFKAFGVGIPKVDYIKGKQFSYRNRISLTDGGFFKRLSKKAIRITKCLCATPAINEWLALHSANRPKGKTNLFDPNFDTRSDDAFSKHKAVAVGSEEVCVCICGKPVLFNSSLFFQSNLSMLEKLGACIQKSLAPELLSGNSKNNNLAQPSIVPPRHLLDLYGGVGTFSTILSDDFSHFTIVESCASDASYAAQNLRGKACTFIALSAKQWVTTLPKGAPLPFDAVVADPPRAGLEREVAQFLAASTVPKIEYVSCNYRTQSRDLAILVAGGYRVTSATIFDFYPNTFEMESLIELTK